MNNLSIITIITTAAVDSINPCAIGVLVFMITFLASLKGSRKKILTIGFTYIFVVFLCYFAAGLGLMRILSALTFMESIYRFLGVIVLIVGILEMRDALSKEYKPLLAIPKKASPKIKKYIHKATIPAAIVLGGLVSLFELPCTGGVYIAILGMLSRTDFSAQSIFYLAVYNFVFVLPLIIILLLSAFGLSSEKIDKWRKSNRRKMRLFIGISLIILSILMITDTI
jgi:cytochrome c biogenesis protein CcdA